MILHAYLALCSKRDPLSPRPSACWRGLATWRTALAFTLSLAFSAQSFGDFDNTIVYIPCAAQRASTTQSEAERLLAGARDLEESIGVSLSARRFELNRLELTLSIAGFAAALGAMFAGIFGARAG